DGRRSGIASPRVAHKLDERRVLARSPPPRGPHSRGPHPAALRSQRQLVDNSPRGSPSRGEQKPLARLTSGRRFTEARTSGLVNVTRDIRQARGRKVATGRETPILPGCADSFAAAPSGFPHSPQNRSPG